MKRWMTAVWALVALAIALPAHAQPMIEHVPQEAVFYVGWEGASKLGSSYDASHMAKLLAEPEVKQLVRQTTQVMGALQDQANDMDTQRVMAVLQVLPALWQYPMAMYAAGPASPVLAIVVQPTRAAKDQVLAKLQEMALMMDVPPTVSEEGKLLVVRFVPPGMEAGAYAAPDISLKASKRFTAALAKCRQAAPLVAYVDVATLRELVKQQAGQQLDLDAQGVNPVKVMEAAGLAEVNAGVLTAWFEHQDWKVHAFVDAPSPRKGFLSLWDDAKLSPSDLANVPASAVSVYAWKLDPTALLERVRTFTQEATPEQATMVDQVLMMGSMFTGVNLQEDFIKAMGSTWIIYSDPSLQGGFLGGGMGMVGQLSDTPRMKQAIEQLKLFAINQLKEQPTDQRLDMLVQFQTIRYRNLDIQTCYAALLSMSWTIADDKLFVSLTPQAVARMVEDSRDPQRSITRDQDFTKAFANIQEHAVSGLQYHHLPSTTPSSYQLLMAISQFANMGLSQQVELEHLLLPPRLDTLLAHVSPSATSFTTDADGLHWRRSAPFPGSDVLAMQLNPNMTTTPILVGTLLPALGAARRTAREMQSMTQIRGIGSGCVLYLQSSTQPPDIAQLLEDNYFTAQYALSPLVDKHEPPGFNDRTSEEKAQWIRLNASYIIVTKGMKDNSDPEFIMVFGRPEDSGPSGMIPVCWADNHTSMEPIERVEEILQKQTGLSMDEHIQMQETGKR